VEKVGLERVANKNNLDCLRRRKTGKKGTQNGNGGIQHVPASQRGKIVFIISEERAGLETLPGKENLAAKGVDP